MKFLLLFFIWGALSCESTYEVVNSCHFQIDYGTDANCQVFSLIKCTNIGGKTAYFEYSSWEKCLQRCCLTQDYYPMTTSSLDECNHQTIIRVIIAMGIGSILFGLWMACLWGCQLLSKAPEDHPCRRFCKKINQFCQTIFLIISCCWKCKCPDRSNPGQYSHLHPEIQSNLAIQQERDPELSSTCAICLSPNLTLQLPCGHSFHSDCIFLWFLKKPICPICRASALSKTLKVFCEICHAPSSYDYQLSQSPHIVPSKICSRCQQDQRQRSRSLYIQRQ